MQLGSPSCHSHGRTRTVFLTADPPAEQLGFTMWLFEGERRRGTLSPQLSPAINAASQVPTRNGACSLRNAAMTESAVIRPVLGFSEGMFSMVNVNLAESASTSMLWQFRSTAGSAQISIVVRSEPM